MKKKLLAILSLTPICLFADFDGLQGQTINEENESKLYYSSLPYAIARQGQRAVDSNASVVGFSELEDIIYSVSDKLHLISTRKEGRSVLGNWPLTRWEHHYFNPPFVEFNEDVGAELTDEGIYWPELFLNPKIENAGCYASTPLRYGDVGNDGQNDLVIFFGNELLVFSPEHQRTVFSMQYHLDDWMSIEETSYLYEGGMYGISEGDSLPQYQSKTSGYAIARLQGVARAFRGHAKVFSDDFDEDGHPDLIVWNKLYRSRMDNDSVEGFEHLSSIWLHYERDLEAQAETDAGITGEYLPQETDEADIKTWLADNELTWNQGYPSVSECPGEEGQLIPEMHDPLLNDPELLQ